MKLADLERIEQEVRDRGFRVRYRNGTEDYQYLPDLDENGAAEAEGASGWAERLIQIAAYKQFRDIAIVGPSLEPLTGPGLTYSYSPLDSTPASAAAEVPLASAAAPTRTFGKTSANPNRLAGHPPLTDEEEASIAAEMPVDPEARAAVDGIPVQGGTVLAESNGICLVGDSNSQVYACPREALKGRTDINWRPKVKRFENVVMGPGSDGRGAGASIPWLTWAGSGVTARAAFHSPTGTWMVRR